MKDSDIGEGYASDGFGTEQAWNLARTTVK